MKFFLKQFIPEKNRILLRNFHKDLKRIFKFFKLQLFSKNISEKNLPQNSLIIEVEDGGLGDHLFHSCIPRLAKQSGLYSKILLSNLSNFRDINHKEIIWQINPYLDGFTNYPGIPIRKRLVNENKNNFIFNNHDENILDKINKTYGLNSGTLYLDPEIYYTPIKKIYLQDKIIFDPNWITNLYEESQIKSTIINYFKKNNIKIDFALKCKKAIFVNEFQIIHDKNFKDFCDVLYSAKSVYCFATGTAVLCSALNINANVFFTKKMNKLFKFSNKHNYIQID